MISRWICEAIKSSRRSPYSPRHKSGRRVKCFGWQLPILTLLPSLDLVEFGPRSFKFVVEEPHRVENFAESGRCFCPVGSSKGEDAVVAQISHDPRLGNFVADEVA